MTDMPRTLPPYVYRERTRHRRTVYYFRRGKGPRTRLPDLDEPGFDTAYRDALLMSGSQPKRIVGAGSLEWLIDRYRETAAYAGLSYATRRQRDNIFKGVVAKSGGEKFADIDRASIVASRDDRADTPFQARHFLDAMRGLFAWALEAGHVTANPVSGVKRLATPATAGFAPWTQADVDAYEACWAAGTRQRVWMHVLLYTGLRRGDAVTLGRQHIRDGVATIRTEKTGIDVHIAIRPQLARTLKAGPTGDLAFICGDRGEPLTKETFGNYFREACNDAGVKKSAHGLRKLAAERAAEAGATVNELEALFGWTGGEMASHYTKNADRKRMAKAAAEKITNAEAPHLAARHPAPRKKQR